MGKKKQKGAARVRKPRNRPHAENSGHHSPDVAGLIHDQENPCMVSAGLLACGRTVDHAGKHAAFGSDGAPCLTWD